MNAAQYEFKSFNITKSDYSKSRNSFSSESLLHTKPRLLKKR